MSVSVLLRRAGLAALLALAACDFAPSGEPPERPSGPFVTTIALGGAAPADTLVLGQGARLAFVQPAEQVPISLLRVFIGTTLVGESNTLQAVDLHLQRVPEGAGRLRVEGVVSYPGVGVRTRDLHVQPVYVERLPVTVDALEAGLEDGFVRLRWQRGGRRLPDSVHITRSGPVDFQGYGQRPLVVVFRLQTAASEVRWRDSSYVGGSPRYHVRAFSVNGEASAEVAFANTPAGVRYVFAREASHLAWQRPPGSRTAAFVVQRLASPFGPPVWEDVAVLDSAARSFALPPAPYGSAVPQPYRLAGRSALPNTPLIPLSERISPLYGTPVPGFNGPTPQTYLYNAAHGMYYVWSAGAQSPNRLTAWSGAPGNPSSSTRDGITAAAVAPDGRLFVATGTNEVCELHPVSLAVQRCARLGSSPTALAAGRGGALLVSRSTTTYPYAFDAQQAGPSLSVGTTLAHELALDASGTWAHVRGRIYERTAEGFVLRYTAPDLETAAFDLDARVGYTVSGTTLTVVDLATGQARAQHPLPVALRSLHVDPAARVLGGEAGAIYHAFDLDTRAPLATVPLAHTPGTQQSYQLLTGRLYQRLPDPSFFYAQTYTFVDLR